MIINIIKLLEVSESTDKDILIAKGFYKYPSSFRDLIEKLKIIWQLRK